MEHVWVDVDGLALDLVCPSTVVPYAADSGTNVSLRQCDGLSVVQGLNGSKELGVLLHKVCQLQEQETPLLRRCRPPAALKGLPGRGDGDIDIFLCALTDGADDFLGRGVDNLDLLLLLAFDPFVVDETGERSITELVCF